MKWKEKYNAVPPTGKRLLGLWSPFLQWSGWGATFLRLQLTLKAGLIMWSSTVRLIEMLSLFLYPASNASALFGVSKHEPEECEHCLYSHIMQTLILLIEWYWMNTDVDGLKIGLLCTYPELWWGQEAEKCNLIVVVLSFNGVFPCIGQIEVESVFTVSG